MLQHPCPVPLPVFISFRVLGVVFSRSGESQSRKSHRGSRTTEERGDCVGDPTQRHSKVLNFVQEVALTRLLLLTLLIQVPVVQPEVVELIRQAEAMIGTDKAYSLEQAELFEKALALEPNLASAHFNVSLIYLSLAAYEKAESHLSRLIELEPDEVRGLLLRAEVYLRTGRPGVAEPDLKQVLEKDPSEAKAWRFLGRAQFETGDFDAALESFSRVQALEPEDRELDLDLGLAKQNLQQSAEAAGHFLRFLEVEPENVDVILLAARSLRDAGKLEGSLELYLKAETLRPEDSDLRRETAYLLLDLERPGEADQRLREGDARPTDLANRAIIALQDNRLLDAEIAMRQAISMEPDNPNFWYELGDVLFLAKQQEQAAEAYQKSLALGARSTRIYRNLGTIWANLKQPEKAKEMLESGLLLAPNDGKMHFHLAVVLERLEDPKGARDHFLQALAKGENEARIHFRLAVLFSQEGAGREALEHLKTALETEPAKYLPFVEQELRNVRSDFDAIRYSREFSEMISKARASLPTTPPQH